MTVPAYRPSNELGDNVQALHGWVTTDVLVAAWSFHPAPSGAGARPAPARPGSASAVAVYDLAQLDQYIAAHTAPKLPHPAGPAADSCISSLGGCN